MSVYQTYKGLPAGWVAQWDPTYQAYFYINETFEGAQPQWEPPIPGLHIPPPPGTTTVVYQKDVPRSSDGSRSMTAGLGGFMVGALAGSVLRGHRAYYAPPPPRGPLFGPRIGGGHHGPLHGPHGGFGGRGGGRMGGRGGRGRR
ncbi:WW domain-containing protein C11B10.08 [Schizosaccharomyces pombe]|uniref:WW domain-containing protein C660.05 n=1 Tax=Schizosaccharomyces pombe (strain 972 / ATCC 24843) TaxID=284812 RepID=YHK5_SCHPO|nr:uncharacterized protein SPBC660.05 [Schizosaccharomyces pombe]O94425.1 RecName: Full=WW domain-containing protein C660.05 [Schizosaccharomyces pombe 972h-]CAA22525.1 conserved fungal protein [Schizosaccharomyces pombe]|eukprot:NP_595084.1 uncharacterized protein SPBC660.05 [Schizosaccharomyces pombe]